MRYNWIFVCILAVIIVEQPAGAQQKYQRPPKEIVEILDAPVLPSPIVSPTGKTLVLGTSVTYPPISDLAEPQLRLAGVRINPRNNALHSSYYYTRFSVKKLPDGPEMPITLPVGARAGYPQWNANGSLFAFSNMTDTTVELWIAEVATGKVRRINNVQLNPVLGSAIIWMPDQKTLLVKTISEKRSGPPAETSVPIGPQVEETGTVTVASSTYESRDLLKTPHDADLFEYYATSQLARIDVSNGAVSNLGKADVISKVDPAPGGQYLLINRIRRPYSFTRTYSRFPTEVEVWSNDGKKIETLASLPLAEQVPIGGVRTGPRLHSWHPTEAATLVWVEALDDGDSYKKVPHHDRILMKPIGGTAVELFKTEQRFSGLDWIEQGGLALVTDYDDDKHWTKTFLLDTGKQASAPRVVWSLNSDDSYHSPGYPVYRIMPNGALAIGEYGGAIFMQGDGASPEGNRPFLDRVDLKSLKTQRIFRSDREHLEYFLDWVDPASMTFLTQRESLTEPPNVYQRSAGSPTPSPIPEGEAAFGFTTRQLTHFSDPTPQLRQISKRLITYKRPDGVDLSFTLYLPPGYKEGTRLPTVVWAYPLDYTDPSTAGQVVATPQQFTSIYGASPVFLTLQGYAVLDDAAMPVVGPTETAYNTFIDQIVANAKAAIDKAIELGVTDPDRVGVGGHSHGALMTANLLAWSDLFRAGLARSGAYNHTLRPFGFQNERRTLYKATETYLKLSPLINADRINEPLLLIHGERDANPGTVPLQSEKLFEAIRGVGGTAKWVVLPLESHGYQARESIEHVLYETVTWFNLYVKNAKPKAKQTTTLNNPPQLLLRLDDNGMNHAVNMAIQQVAETGVPFSTSVMFTCPWYQEAVDVLKRFPKVSVGVHLVLNSEWKHYRWGPVLGRSAVPSLVDKDGYFLPSTDGFLASPYKLDEVEKELEAQINRGLQSGLKIDYVDYHMWTAVSTPELRAIVEKLAKKYQLGISRYFGENYQSLFDVSITTKKDQFFQRLATLPKNKINLLVMHVAQDTPEMKALIDMNNAGMHSDTEPLVAMHRSAELNILLSQKFQDAIKNGAAKLVTYRDVAQKVGLDKMKAPPED